MKQTALNQSETCQEGCKEKSSVPSQALNPAKDNRFIEIALKFKIPQLLILSIGFLFFVFLKGPPTAGDEVWESSYIYKTPIRIQGSAHLGQTLNYFILTSCQKIFNEPFGSGLALRATSYLLSLIYLAGLFLLSLKIEDLKRECIFIVIGLVSPITMFFHGLLVLALYLSGKYVSRYPFIISILGGLSAALHGGGLFFLPGIIVLNLSLLPDSAEKMGEKIRSIIESFFVFFGAYGVFFLIYMMAKIPVTPGDADSVRLGVFGLIPLAFSLSFTKLLGMLYAYTINTLAVLIHGAPSIFVLLFAIFIGSKKNKRVELPHIPWQAWFFSGMGIVFVILFYSSGSGLAFDVDLYIPAVSIISLLCSFCICSINAEKKVVVVLISLTLFLNISMTGYIWWRTTEHHMIKKEIRRKAELVKKAKKENKLIAPQK